MTTTQPRPRRKPPGRPTGTSDTKETILSCARDLFARNGFNNTSVRAIAGAAGVDAALVHHYFTSKAALFLLALTGVAWEVERDIATVVDGPTDGVGHRAVQLLLECRDASVSAPLAALVDGPQGEVAARARAAIEMVAREVFVPVAAHFGHADATLRAQLAASALVGLAPEPVQTWPSERRIIWKVFAAV